MVRKASLVLFFGMAFAFPNPDPDPVSKTTSQHSAHLPLTTTPSGEIKGTILTSRLGKTIYTFRGIRYAKAPINELRFQPPAPPEKWEGVFNATQDGASCPQPNLEPVSEDCLFLNVYSSKLPKGNDNPKRPVIVFLHNGKFSCGSGKSDVIGPHYLLDEEVVLVVPNYRLGTLGFLSTGDKEAPGNNAFKDQVQVLKWVKDNIVAFGGDPDCVTLAGHSAGGVSVSLHLVSPMSKGLFHRVIAMSGSAYGNWPLPTNQLDLAKKQAKLVNCPDDTVANIIKCLRTKPAEELGNSLPGFKEFGDEPVIQWGPVVEQDFGQPRFLTAHPVELVLNGEFEKVPVLSGVTSDEFGWRAFNVIANESLASELDKDFEKIAPVIFMYEKDTERSNEISKDLKEFYFGEKKIDNSSLASLAQLFADSLTGFNVHRTVKVLAEKSAAEVYYYRFNYKGKYSHFYLPDSNNSVPYGVSNGDDLIYLFYVSTKFPFFKENNQESATVDKMTSMWANFAKKGKPISETSDALDNSIWDAFTDKTKKFMDIGNKLAMMENMCEKRYAEWEKLYPLSNYENNAKHG